MLQIKSSLKRIVINYLPILYNFLHKYRVYLNQKAEKKKKESYSLYGKSVLSDIFFMVLEKKYPIACYYGTLLGLVRDDALIPWDDDLDFIVIDGEGFSWSDFEKNMNNNGFKKYRTIEINNNIVGQSYKKHGVLCDFSLKKQSSSLEYSYYGCYQIPGETYINGKDAFYQYWKCLVPNVKSLVQVKLFGLYVLIPENYEEILESYYGKDWRVPNSNFIPEREQVNILTKITYH